MSLDPFIDAVRGPSASLAFVPARDLAVALATFAAPDVVVEAATWPVRPGSVPVVYEGWIPAAAALHLALREHVVSAEQLLDAATSQGGAAPDRRSRVVMAATRAVLGGPKEPSWVEAAQSRAADPDERTIAGRALVAAGELDAAIAVVGGAESVNAGPAASSLVAWSVLHGRVDEALRIADAIGGPSALAGDFAALEALSLARLARDGAAAWFATFGDGARLDALYVRHLGAHADMAPVLRQAIATASPGSAGPLIAELARCHPAGVEAEFDAAEVRTVGAANGWIEALAHAAGGEAALRAIQTMRPDADEPGTGEWTALVRGATPSDPIGRRAAEALATSAAADPRRWAPLADAVADGRPDLARDWLQHAMAELKGQKGPVWSDVFTTATRIDLPLARMAWTKLANAERAYVAPSFAGVATWAGQLDLAAKVLAGVPRSHRATMAPRIGRAVLRAEATRRCLERAGLPVPRHRGVRHEGSPFDALFAPL